MITPKSICIEALARANLVPRKRTCPADMLESAFQLLKSIVSNYNFRNFININQKSYVVKATTNEIELVDEELDISSIASVQVKLSNDVNTDLTFLNYSEFLSTANDYVYTWTYNQDKILVKIKNGMLNRTIIINYNGNLELGSLDKELFLPSIYEELFIQALTVKLGKTYPRLDKATLAEYKEDLAELEKTVTKMVASNKIMTRNEDIPSNLANLISGNFIYG